MILQLKWLFLLLKSTVLNKSFYALLKCIIKNCRKYKIVKNMSGICGLPCCGNSTHTELVPCWNDNTHILSRVEPSQPELSQVCARGKTPLDKSSWCLKKKKCIYKTITCRLVACWVGRESLWCKNCCSCNNRAVTVRWCNSTDKYEPSPWLSDLRPMLRWNSAASHVFFFFF